MAERTNCRRVSPGCFRERIFVYYPIMLPLPAVSAEQLLAQHLQAFAGLSAEDLRLAEGGYRDTVVFSIIESEWLAVKRHLQFLLEEREPQSCANASE